MTFANLEAAEWCDLEKLSENFLAVHGTKVSKPFEALSVIIDSLNTVSLKKQGFMELRDYAVSCKEYLGLKYVKDKFVKVYQDSHLNAQLNEEN
jgi:CRISPR/Cas system-associated endonuclease/helicase Cas3